MQNQNPVVVNAEIVKSGSVELAEREQDAELIWLSDSERYALDYFRSNYQKGGSKTYPLAPSLQEQLFQLYLNGKSLSEIRALNPHVMLGQVVDAAVTGKWHQLRQEYLGALQQRAAERLRQIACEAVDHLADEMAATHKLRGEAIKRYLQTGDESDLGGVSLCGIKQYKDVAELLLKLTGQDKNSTLTVKGEISHTTQDAPQGTGTVKTLAQRVSEKKAKELEDQKIHDEQERRRLAKKAQ